MKIIFTLVLVWLIFSLNTNLNHLYLPNIDGVFKVLYLEILSGELFNNFIVTFLRVLVGLFLGLLLGFPLGVLLGTHKKLHIEFMPLIDFIRGIPTSMLFPLFIILFGIGEVSKIVIVASVTFPIILVNTISGCLPRKGLEDRTNYLTLHKKRLPRFTIIKSIVWDALPSIVGGVKVAISIGLVLTIVTEMYFVASSGIGWAANQAYLDFNIDLMYLYIILVGLIGLGLNIFFDRIQNKF